MQCLTGLRTTTKNYVYSTRLSITTSQDAANASNSTSSLVTQVIECMLRVYTTDVRVRTQRRHVACPLNSYVSHSEDNLIMETTHHDIMHASAGVFWSSATRIQTLVLCTNSTCSSQYVYPGFCNKK